MSTDMALSLHSVADRGVANLERVVLQVMGQGLLSEYGIVLGLQVGTEPNPRPYVDSCFLFATHQPVAAGDWIFVYTGPGRPAVIDLEHPFSGKLYTYYWGRTETSFYHPSRVPILFQIWETATLPAPPMLLPQTQGPRTETPSMLDSTSHRILK